MRTAIQTVEYYLACMEARDLSAARALLASDFKMTFPGPVEFTQLEDLVIWGAARYRSISKRYEQFDELTTTQGQIVYCYGWLHGTWLDGSAFDGVRFIDRFLVDNNQLREQLVWNDLAETLVGSTPKQ
jgi:hypothetical protein